MDNAFSHMHIWTQDVNAAPTQHMENLVSSVCATLSVIPACSCFEVCRESQAEESSETFPEICPELPD